MKKLLNNALWVMLVAMAAANALLINQNLQLRRALEGSRPDGLKAGEKVRPFTASGVDGRQVSVEYEGSGPKSVLLFFTPTCRFCHEQFAYWREILERADGGRFEVIGVVDGAEDKARLEEYLRRMGCSAASRTPLRVALLPEEVRRGYKLEATPITLIVANDGTVEKIWAGKWGDEEVAEAGLALGFDFQSAGLPN